MVKNFPANVGYARDTVSIPGSGRSLGVGNGNPLQYSCLENSTDRGAWWTTIQGFCIEPDTTERLRTQGKLPLFFLRISMFRFPEFRIIWQIKKKILT